uniref:Integrin subunit alpha E n=1 Tax=Lepisosteus oculatus TaxID=7918 RepID=W5M6Q5_LEPOC|nr:PREDICTED: integrin alpha-E isoform X1 [Lepisosteus oculatus]
MAHNCLLWLITVYAVEGFNIYSKPIKTFEELNSPSLGQSVLQYEDGILVTSPLDNMSDQQYGRLYDCKVSAQCTEVSLTAKEKSYRKPIISAAKSSDGSTYLVCQQHRTRKATNEDLNGVCSLLKAGFQEISDIAPASLVVKQMKRNNTNANKQEDESLSVNSGSALHRRKRESSNQEEEEDEDAGTEIAFVLDGSGSISGEDFERAKEFVTNVMKNVWETCFDCRFALVQYGKDIRTELSLKENEKPEYALRKVSDIQQIYNYTKTASAMYHVLEHVFVAENGSKENAKKIMIVLTDGKIFLDTMNLSDVLMMPKMKAVTRFAIGVGADFNQTKAVTELQDIASDPDDEHLFKVDNYAALDGILSLLEKSITGIEGTQQGAAFLFELSEAGFSIDFAIDGTVLFGAVGAYDWNGGLIIKNPDDTIRFLNESSTKEKLSYLGYSVAAVKGVSGSLYVSGAPRHSFSGSVLVFNGTSHAAQQTLSGEQVGSYFGAELCVLDTDKNGITDHLLIGAPLFHQKGEEGKVYVYRLSQGLFIKESEWRGMNRYTFARFGSAIANIGDIDDNGYNDIAVGAPMEGDGKSGSIYIYNGYENGIKDHHSQRIAAADFDVKLRFFGQSVSGMSDLDKDGQIDISVGSLGKVTVLSSLPVIVFKPQVTLDPPYISLNKQSGQDSKKISAKICFNSVKREIKKKTEELPIHYHLVLDPNKEKKRLSFANGDPKSISGIFKLTNTMECLPDILLQFLECADDCFSPVEIKLNFTLNLSSESRPLRVLDMLSPNEISQQLPFETNCGTDKICTANITLSTSLPQDKTLVIGSTKDLSLGFNMKNIGEDSHMTILVLTYPHFLQYNKLSLLTENKGISCANPVDNTKLTCQIRYPVMKAQSEVNFTISWQIEESHKIQENSTQITANITCENNGLQVLTEETYRFAVKNALKVSLTGKAKPAYIHVTEESMGKKQELEYLFQIHGENRYNANIVVNIDIPLKERDTQVTIVSYKARHTTNCSAQPQDNGKTYRLTCTVQELDELLTVEASVAVISIKDQRENLTARAFLSFDSAQYEADEGGRYEEVLVTIEKLTVVKSMAVIVGSSIGGFVFLAFLILILIKCGFFRRRYQKARVEQKSDQDM